MALDRLFSSDICVPSIEICVDTLLLFQRLGRLDSDSIGCLWDGLGVINLVITLLSCDWRVDETEAISLEIIMSTGPSHDTACIGRWTV